MRAIPQRERPVKVLVRKALLSGGPLIQSSVAGVKLMGKRRRLGDEQGPGMKGLRDPLRGEDYLLRATKL